MTTTNAFSLYQKATSFTVAWSATDDSGVATYESRARLATPSAGFSSYNAWYDGTATGSTYIGAAGQTVCVSTTAQDAYGNWGAFSAERCTVIPIDDVSLAATKFTRKTASGYFDGTFSLSVATGAKLTSATITTKRLALLVTTCPSCGSVQVKWKGAVVGTLSLFSATTKHKVLLPDHRPFGRADRHRPDRDALDRARGDRRVLRQPQVAQVHGSGCERDSCRCSSMPLSW